MVTRYRQFCMCFLAGCLLAVPALAQPTTMTYQGVLRDATGDTVDDGAYAMEFRIYDGGGTMLWSESHGAVVVTSGVFSVELGSSSPLGALFADNSGAQLALEIAADTGAGLETFAPRVPLTSAPYAFMAAEAGSIDWSDIANMPGGFADGMDDGVTGVAAGTGLTGGGASGSVTLDVDFAGTGAADTASRSDHTHTAGDITGPIDADTLDGLDSVDLDNTDDIAAHNALASAHPAIRSEIDTDIDAHDVDGAAHADIRTEIDTDIDAHDVDGAAHADIRADITSAAVPLGTILPVFLGLPGVPSVTQLRDRGWAQCDGTSPADQGITGSGISSTPNINGNNYFIRGGNVAGGTQAGQVGDHNHTGSFSGGSTSAAPDHTHRVAGNTSGVGNHQHTQYVTANSGSNPSGDLRQDWDGDPGTLSTYYHTQTGGAGAHSHSFDVTSYGGGGHSHTVSGNVTVGTHNPGGETRPKNITLVFFMKVL